jgi:hypothetical protein
VQITQRVSKVEEQLSLWSLENQPSGLPLLVVKLIKVYRMRPDFESPPKKWVVLATVGGVVTAIAAIVGLESLSGSLHKTTPDRGSRSRPYI